MISLELHYVFFWDYVDTVKGLKSVSRKIRIQKICDWNSTTSFNLKKIFFFFYRTFLRLIFERLKKKLLKNTVGKNFKCELKTVEKL